MKYSFYYHQILVFQKWSLDNIISFQTLGPCFIDTTSPFFTGDITVSLSGEYLVSNWAAGDVSDSEELFQLDYQFAIGKH